MAGRTRRRIAYRKRRQNRFSMILVTLVVAMVTLVVFVKGIELRQKIDVKVQEGMALDAQIEKEQNRTLEIEEPVKEVQTKGYIEDIAREKLGLVYEGEILFKAK